MLALETSISTFTELHCERWPTEVTSNIHFSSVILFLTQTTRARTDRQPVHGADLLSDGEHVQEGLGRVFAHAITRIDDRLVAVLRGFLSRNAQGVSRYWEPCITGKMGNRWMGKWINKQKRERLNGQLQETTDGYGWMD